MPIPTQGEAFRITLGLMTDGQQRTNKQIKAKALEILNLTDEELREKTSTGITLWESRIDWSTQYLQRALLLERIRRGLYVITDEGHKVYESGIDGIDLSRQLDAWIKERNPWNIGAESKKKEIKKKHRSITSDMSPEEQISALVDDLNESLSAELMDLILERDPAFFEKVVVELLERMGYGKGEVTSYTNDGGIDGLITTDELGFRPIYTQAKRYAPDNKIGRPTLQAFVGALLDQRDGVFITTSSFTDDAIKYANDYPGKTITLIDGKHLTELMIKYDLGVAVEDTIEIKRIDSDYFGDE